MTKQAWLKKIRNDCQSQISVMMAGCQRIKWDQQADYADWLAQSFHYVRHATRVLSLAAARCSLDEEALHKKLLEGIREEMNHEVLALNDLKSIGEHVKHFPEHAATSAYYQELYCNIEADGPAALIGYFLPLEGLAAIGFGRIKESVCACYGENAATFIATHCTIDSRHFDEGLDYLDQLPDIFMPAIYKNMMLSAELYVGVLKSIYEPRHELHGPVKVTA